MLVYNGNVVLFIGEVLGECSADLPRSENNDFHRPLDPPNDPPTP
jgi:hypothetical protein